MPKRKRCISTGKIIYPKEEDAIDVLKAAKKTSRNDSGKIPIRYYECEDCGGFHLSSRPERYGHQLSRKLRGEFLKFLGPSE